MPLHPPSTLYDRIDEAKLLSDLERAQLTALAEQLWAALELRVTRAEKAGLERAFWSLISEWEGLPAIVEETSLPGEFGMDRIRDLEMRLGETLIGGLPSAPRIDLNSIEPDEEVLYDFSRQMARRFGVFPVRKQERLLELATAKPDDGKLWLDLAMATACRIRLLSAPEREIERSIKRYYPDARDPIPRQPFRNALHVRNPESLTEDGFDLEFSRMEEVGQLCSDLVGRLLSEGIDSAMLEPAEGCLQVNIFVDGWRPMASWPRNLWRALDLAFRRLSHAPTQPWEQEAFLDWPFMGAPYRIWLMWKKIDGVETLSLQPFLPSPDE